MQTDRDDDDPIPGGLLDTLKKEMERKHLEALQREAERMTAAKENVITAGAAGEPTLAETTIDGMTITQRPDDPLGVLRISLGELRTRGANAYLVHRGDVHSTLRLLERAVETLKRSML